MFEINYHLRMKHYLLLTLLFLLPIIASAQNGPLADTSDIFELYPAKFVYKNIKTFPGFGKEISTLSVDLLTVTTELDGNVRKFARISISGYNSILTKDELIYLREQINRYSILNEKPEDYTEYRNQIEGNLDFGAFYSKNRWQYYFDTDEVLNRGKVTLTHAKLVEFAGALKVCIDSF